MTLKEYLTSKLNNKQGMSAFAWILLGVSLMFILFIPVDMALQSVQAIEFNGVLDNAVSSAISRIDEEEIKRGEVVIDQDKAMAAVYDAIATGYNLEYQRVGHKNYRFIPSSLENSKLTSIPHVEIQFVTFNRDEIRNNTVKKTQPFKSIGEASDGYVLDNVKENTIAIRVKADFPSQILSRLSGFTFDRVSSAKATLSGQGEAGGN